MEDTICAERRSTRGMERERRYIVRNVVFFFLFLCTIEFSHSAVQRLSRITISLYGRKTMTTDILVGREEIVCKPRHGRSNSWKCYSYIWLIVVHAELEIIFHSADGHAGRPAEPVTVFLMVAVSANTSSPLTAAVNTPGPAAADIPVSEGSAVRPTAQTNVETTQLTSVIAP